MRSTLFIAHLLVVREQSKANKNTKNRRRRSERWVVGLLRIRCLCWWELHTAVEGVTSDLFLSLWLCTPMERRIAARGRATSHRKPY